MNTGCRRYFAGRHRPVTRDQVQDLEIGPPQLDPGAYGVIELMKPGDEIAEMMLNLLCQGRRLVRLVVI